MTDKELETILLNRCENLNLKAEALEGITKILSNEEDEDFLCGFDKSEIKQRFDGFQFLIKRELGTVIRTKIGLYIEGSQAWLDGLEPIGYYELETDFNGEILDDYFVIEKEKHLKVVNIISEFQVLNQCLPIQYLKRNSITYPLTTYLSLIGTLFISKNFEAVGVFISRAYSFLGDTNNNIIDATYLKKSKSFLIKLTKYLITNELISQTRIDMINENKLRFEQNEHKR